MQATAAGGGGEGGGEGEEGGEGGEGGKSNCKVGTRWVRQLFDVKQDLMQINTKYYLNKNIYVEFVG